MRPCTSEQQGRKSLGPGTMHVTPAHLWTFSGERNKVLSCSDYHYAGFLPSYSWHILVLDRKVLKCTQSHFPTKWVKWTPEWSLWGLIISSSFFFFSRFDFPPRQLVLVLWLSLLQPCVPSQYSPTFLYSNGNYFLYLLYHKIFIISSNNNWILDDN